MKRNLIKELFEAHFTPMPPKQEERQEFTIITNYDGKDIQSTPIPVSLLHTQEELANEANLTDNAMTDYNPADDGFIPVETKSGKIYYINDNLEID